MGQNKGVCPRARRVKRIRRAGLVVFILYLISLTYFLFFADWYDHAPGMHWQYHYNFIPFQEITRFLKYGYCLSPMSIFLNLFGNVIGFLPFGFFLPVISRKNRKMSRVVLAGAVSSACIELIQLVTKTGVCDIDDVILNTLGAFLGYLLFLLADEIRKRSPMEAHYKMRKEQEYKGNGG